VALQAQNAKDAIGDAKSAAANFQQGDWISGLADVANLADNANWAPKRLPNAGHAKPVLGVVDDVPQGGTYVLRDAEEVVRRTGRTKHLDIREQQHARHPETKDLNFEIDKRADNYAAQRGEILQQPVDEEIRNLGGGLGFF
jgi:hypothetical protein